MKLATLCLAFAAVAIALRLEVQVVGLAAMLLLARGMVSAWPATSSSARPSRETLRRS